MHCRGIVFFADRSSWISWRIVMGSPALFAAISILDFCVVASTAAVQTPSDVRKTIEIISVLVGGHRQSAMPFPNEPAIARTP
jgi:hypothetical protein